MGARHHGVKFSSRKELVKSHQVQSLYEGIVEELNQNLAQFEKLKKVLVVPDELSIADGTLTPSMKLRRRNLTDRYKKEIDALYAESESQSAHNHALLKVKPRYFSARRCWDPTSPATCGCRRSARCDRHCVSRCGRWSSAHSATFLSSAACTACSHSVITSSSCLTSDGPLLAVELGEGLVVVAIELRRCLALELHQLVVVPVDQVIHFLADGVIAFAVASSLPARR